MITLKDIKQEHIDDVTFDLMNDVLTFMETHTIEDLKYVPSIEDEYGQQTPFDELQMTFDATICSHIIAKANK